jgi:hypothetical protein
VNGIYNYIQSNECIGKPEAQMKKVKLFLVIAAVVFANPLYARPIVADKYPESMLYDTPSK